MIPLWKSPIKLPMELPFGATCGATRGATLWSYLGEILTNLLTAAAPIWNPFVVDHGPPGYFPLCRKLNSFVGPAYWPWPSTGSSTGSHTGVA